jgi:hypothetical protein
MAGFACFWVDQPIGPLLVCRGYAEKMSFPRVQYSGRAPGSVLASVGKNPPNLNPRENADVTV